jgi:hypothetical protein
VARRADGALRPRWGLSALASVRMQNGLPTSSAGSRTRPRRDSAAGRSSWRGDRGGPAPGGRRAAGAWWRTAPPTRRSLDLRPPSRTGDRGWQRVGLECACGRRDRHQNGERRFGHVASGDAARQGSARGRPGIRVITPRSTRRRQPARREYDGASGPQNGRISAGTTSPRGGHHRVGMRREPGTKSSVDVPPD